MIPVYYKDAQGNKISREEAIEKYGHPESRQKSERYIKMQEKEKECDSQSSTNVKSQLVGVKSQFLCGRQLWEQ